MSPLQPEAGIFYGVCWFVVVIRLISRRLHRGSWKLLQWDDYLILLAMVGLIKREAVLLLMGNVGHRHSTHRCYARNCQGKPPLYWTNNQIGN